MMFKIKNGKSYFVIDKSSCRDGRQHDEDDAPLAKIKYRDPSKLSQSRWIDTYDEDIQCIFDDLSDILCNLYSDKHICHVDFTNLSRDFTEFLYKTSYNTSRTWAH